MWSGPLPPPEVLRRYEEILPNTAEHILTMAEQEQKFRHVHDDGKLQLAMKERLRGQIYGVAALFACLGGALASMYLRQSEILAVAFIAAPVLTVAARFIKK